MTLRPVTPGHVAVRPRPTARNPKAWCIVTVGPVKHYRRAVEVDGNPSDPQVLLHAYEFPNRDTALWTARHVLRAGWLPTCDEMPGIGIGPEQETNSCIHPLGHAGKHGNSHFRWDDSEITFDTFPDDDGLRLYDVHPESVLQEARRAAACKASEEQLYWPIGGQDEVGRCPEIEPYGTDELRCQLPEGHEGTHHVHQNQESFVKWLDKATADRMLGR